MRRLVNKQVVSAKKEKERADKYKSTGIRKIGG
jgi:hypothetical protein